MNIEQLNEWNRQLNGLPAGTLVFVACLAVGYAVKLMPWIPNRAIPSMVILAGPPLNAALAESLQGRVEITRTIIVGMVIGVASWIAHHLVISRIEDWIGEKIPTVGKILGHERDIDKPTQTDHTKTA